MASSPDSLREHLDPDERIAVESSAVLGEFSHRTPVSVGITDRRLLCVSETGEAVSAGLASICTVRSTSRTRRTYRGTDHRVRMAAGALLAILGLLGVLRIAGPYVASFLLLVGVGGVGSAAYLRRDPGALDRVIPISLDTRAVVERLAAFDPAAFANGCVDVATERPSLAIGSALVCAAVLVGSLLVAPAALVPPFALLFAAGVVVVEYAYRHRAEYEGIEIVVERRTALRIGTLDGSTIRLETGPSESFGRTLHGLVSANGAEAIRDVSLPA